MVSHFALTGVSGLLRQRTRHHWNLRSLKQIIYINFKLLS